MGVDPDLAVDNLPQGAFLGEDAQLKAAIQDLREHPKMPVPRNASTAFNHAWHAFPAPLPIYKPRPKRHDERL